MEAMVELAQLYGTGSGVQKDNAKWKILIERAAELGHPEAQTRLGIFLVNSSNSNPDYVTASRWFKKAAAQGVPRAITNIGLMHVTGNGLAQDGALAFKYLVSAALNGDELASKGLERAKDWMSIEDVERARTISHLPELQILLGPPAGGHLTEVFEAYQEMRKISSWENFEDGHIANEWIKHERKAAEIFFGEIGQTKEPSELLSGMWGKPVTVKSYFVGEAPLRGQWFGNIQIGFSNILDDSGFPMFSMPDDQATKAVTSLIGLVTGKKWVYHSFMIPSIDFEDEWE